MTAVFAVVKRLMASNKISFILTALVVLCATSSGDVVLSNGNYTWLLAIMTPFFFVFHDFKKLMYLGTSKKDYFAGCLISYGILAFGISLVNTGIHGLIDPAYPARTVINLMDVCHWTENGWLAAVICIFTPVAPLRAVLAGVFQLIMLNGSALLHIGVCLLLSAALSLAGIAVLKRKTL